RQRDGAPQGRLPDAQDQLRRSRQARSGEPSGNDRRQGRSAGSDQRLQEHYCRPAAGIRRQLGRGKFLDGFDEGPKPRRLEEPRGEPGHRDHPQSHRPARRERAGDPGARPRPLSDSCPTSGCGRSGAGQGNHAVHGNARDQAIAGRTLWKPAAGVTGTRRRAASGRCLNARQEHRLPQHRRRRSLVHNLSSVGRDRSRSSHGGAEHGREWPAGGSFYPYQRGETQDLSMTLRSGALPASIKYLEERTVGPSLGADSIRSGVQAAMVGMLAVLVFMLIYYRWAGVNADIALILNLVILLGFMGYFGAVLTLPGIAGVILTVGMGVDSNVLIFERIREELRNGKTPPSAVEQGFSHAWITIVDTHVTTIVSAAILFLFGTGPVKGFAVTLTFGLLANLFTAIFVSRAIFDSILNRHLRGEPLSI